MITRRNDEEKEEDNGSRKGRKILLKIVAALIRLEHCHGWDLISGDGSE